MTGQKKRVYLRIPAPGQIMFGFMCVFSLVLILRNSDIAVRYMSTGLLLCVRTVIPSLFPFMVISELIIYSGAADIAGRIFDRPVRWLFGISGESVCAVLLGSLCGFPIGARTAVSLLDNGKICKKEASRLLTFCNNPSSAFIISAVGISLYSNRSIGVTLYFITLVNAFLIGLFQRLFIPCPISNSYHNTKHYPFGVDAFTSSVTNAASGMLSICGYVVFFSTVIGCLSDALYSLGISKEMSALIYGAVELSGGVSASSALGASVGGICMSAFIIGWSGLSVHFQIISVCSGRGLCFRGYFFAKFIQGLLNALSMYIVCRLFPRLLTTPAESAARYYASTIARPYILIILVLFAAAIFCSTRKAP